MAERNCVFPSPVATDLVTKSCLWRICYNSLLTTRWPGAHVHAVSVCLSQILCIRLEKSRFQGQSTQLYEDKISENMANMNVECPYPRTCNTQDWILLDCKNYRIHWIGVLGWPHGDVPSDSKWWWGEGDFWFRTICHHGLLKAV